MYELPKCTQQMYEWFEPTYDSFKLSIQQICKQHEHTQQQNYLTNHMKHTQQ